MAEVYKSGRSNESNAEFFCENCRKPVSTSEAMCPHCGAIFSGVKCPSCNYSGTMDLFVTGCPRCGYVQDGRTKKKRTSVFEISRKVFWAAIAFFLGLSVLLGYIYFRLM